jgi:serine protease Do
MRDEIPYINPTMILKFFNEQSTKLLEQVKPKIGDAVTIPPIGIIDYFITIPEKYRHNEPYADKYHNALLRMFQKLVNEGLLTPSGNKKGFYQQFMGNGFGHPQFINYGYYDFLIYGFPAIRENFEEAVRPIIINQGVKDKDEKIGTGFVIAYKRNFYFVTARHCLPENAQLKITPLLPKQPQTPIAVFAPKDENIDLAVVEFTSDILLSTKYFYLSTPNLLDPILTMGFPPIQGLTEAIQVSETSIISSSLKSSVGEVTGEGTHYWGGLKEHFLISARVKGGCSGSPVINRYGLVVGVVIELLHDGEKPDLLGYGVAISSNVLNDLLDSISGDSNKMEYINYQITSLDNCFVISKQNKQ